jgi:hypothetical protein
MSTERSLSFIARGTSAGSRRAAGLALFNLRTEKGLQQAAGWPREGGNHDVEVEVLFGYWMNTSRVRPHLRRIVAAYAGFAKPSATARK